jgi:hypothetical protein
MKKSALLSGLILVMITMSVPLSYGSSSRELVQLTSQDTHLDASLPANQEYLDALKDSLTLTVYDPNDSMNGLNLFAVWAYGRGEAGLDHSIIVVTDMEGNILRSLQTNRRVHNPEFVDSKTIMYMDPDSSDLPGVYLWDIETTTSQRLGFPVGHHDVEYNPMTDSYLTLQYEAEEYNGEPMWYDDIVEYTASGAELWRWDASVNLGFNETEYTLRNERGGPGAEYCHTNTIFWDMEEDVIYYNARNIDTFYKINKTTGQIIWAAGRMGDMTMYDLSGKKKTSLWYHSHAVEMIGPDRFVMFDNDYYNLTRGTRYGATSRLIEISIDEVNMTAREEWVWAAPQDSASVLLGDADRMPNGNTIGTFGLKGIPSRFTEVTPEGDIVWEFRFLPGDFEYNLYRHERYFEDIKVEISEDSFNVGDGDDISFNLDVLNTFRVRYYSDATVSVTDGIDEIHSVDFSFAPNWEATSVPVEFYYSGSGLETLTVTVTNSDGISTSVEIVVESSDYEPPNYTSLMLMGLLGLAILVLIWKTE